MLTLFPALALGLACGPQADLASPPADAGQSTAALPPGEECCGTAPGVHTPSFQGGSPSLSLPASAHELQDLVCQASADLDLSWTLDGQPWEGATATTDLPGDTIPAHALAAGQTWACTADLGARAETTIAPYVHPVVLDPVDAAPGDSVVLHYRGELLDQGPVQVRVGYDGWSDQGEATPTQGRTAEGGTQYRDELVLDEDGRAELTIPEGVAGMHLSFFTEDSPPREEDELLWGFQVPALGPWLTVDPDGGLALHFLSTARGPATVELEWEGGSLQLTDDSGDELHHIRLDDVPAGVDLDYRVAEASGRSSPTWTTHRVDPGAGELTVLAAADMQDNGKVEQRWATVAQAMLDTAPDADLLVLPGDLAANDHPGDWWLYFHNGGELFASVPQVIAVGNHDTPGIDSSPDTTSVIRYFDPQGDGPGPEVGLVAYGPVDVLLLNSELESELSPGGSQYLWAQETLQQPTTAAFTLAAFHRPAYDVGERFADEQQRFRPVTALFDGRVDLVLMGHEHIYQRFEPLQYDAESAPSGHYGTGQDDGVAYMVLPSAGNNGLFQELVDPDAAGKVRSLLATPVLEPDQDTIQPFHGFAEARIEGGRMDVVTWEVDLEDEVQPVEAFVIVH